MVPFPFCIGLITRFSLQEYVLFTQEGHLPSDHRQPLCFVVYQALSTLHLFILLNNSMN